MATSQWTDLHGTINVFDSYQGKDAYCVDFILDNVNWWFSFDTVPISFEEVSVLSSPVPQITFDRISLKERSLEDGTAEVEVTFHGETNWSVKFRNKTEQIVYCHPLTLVNSGEAVFKTFV